MVDNNELLCIKWQRAPQVPVGFKSHHTINPSLIEEMTEPVAPSAVYSTRTEEVGLRIATGGSGQSGLLEALAKAFIQL